MRSKIWKKLGNDKWSPARIISPTHGTLRLYANGTFSYKHDGSEEQFDSFAYVANDGTQNSAIMSVTITVQPVNDAPLVMTDIVSVEQGGMATKLVTGDSSVLDNDTDVDGPTLSAVLVQEPAFGTLTLNSDGTFAYQHAGGRSTVDAFRYKASDGEEESNLVDVLIQIDTTVSNPEPTTSSETSIYLPLTSQ